MQNSSKSRTEQAVLISIFGFQFCVCMILQWLSVIDEDDDENGKMEKRPQHVTSELVSITGTHSTA